MKRYILQPMKNIVERLETDRLEHRISQKDLS